MATSISKSLALKLTVNTVQFAKGLNDAKRLNISFALSLSQTASKVSGAFVGLGNTIRMVGDAIKAVIGAASEPVRLANEVEDARVTFGVMLGDLEQAKNLIADIQQFADVTPFQSPELIKTARILMATGTETEQMISTLHRLGDVAAGVNAPIEDVSLVFAKAHARQKLMVRDINQWVSRGIPIYTELKKVMGGVSGPQLRTMITAGEVTFNHLAQALTNMTDEGGKFFQMTEKRSQTVTGLWSTMTDLFIRNMQRVGDIIVESFDLKRTMNRVSEFLLWLRDNIKGYIKPFFDELGNAFRAVWAIGKVAWEQFGQPAFASFWAWLQMVTGKMPTLSDMVFMFWEAWARGWAFAIAGGRIFVSWLIQAAAWVMKTHKQLMDFGSSVMGVFASIAAGVALVVGAFRLVAAIAQGVMASFSHIIEGILQFRELLQVFLVSIFETIVGTIQGLIGFLQPVGYILVLPFILAWEAMVALWSMSAPIIDKIVIQPLIRLLMIIPNTIMRIASFIGEAIQKLAPDLGKPFRDMQEALEKMGKFDEETAAMLDLLAGNVAGDGLFGGQDAITDFFSKAKEEFDKLKAELLKPIPIKPPGNILDPSIEDFPGKDKKLKDAKKEFAAAMERGSKEAFGAIAAFQFGGERQKTQAEMLKQQLQEQKRGNGLLKDLVDLVGGGADEGEGDVIDFGLGGF